MHKLYLTEPECDKIQGAQNIIEVLGYFPAMEDTILEDVDITYTHHINTPFQVSLLFDLSCGGRQNINFDKKRIRMTFYGVRDIYIDTNYGPPWEWCEAIKFINCEGREKIRQVKQDFLPSLTPIIPRPFTGFVIGNGKYFYLEFFDEECTVDAYFED